MVVLEPHVQRQEPGEPTSPPCRWQRRRRVRRSRTDTHPSPPDRLHCGGCSRVLHLSSSCPCLGCTCHRGGQYAVKVKSILSVLSFGVINKFFNLFFIIENGAFSSLLCVCWWFDLASWHKTESSEICYHHYA